MKILNTVGLRWTSDNSSIILYSEDDGELNMHEFIIFNNNEELPAKFYKLEEIFNRYNPIYHTISETIFSPKWLDEVTEELITLKETFKLLERHTYDDELRQKINSELKVFGIFINHFISVAKVGIEIDPKIDEWFRWFFKKITFQKVKKPVKKYLINSNYTDELYKLHKRLILEIKNIF